MGAYLGQALKRRLYPTVFCYHGCVSRREDVLTFREHVVDVQAHVRIMQRAGYTFILPSQYKAWQLGSVSFDYPVTCLHMDDGLASIELVVPWLIEQGVPCGLSLITRRLRKKDPDTDFISWANIAAWANTGLVEVMCHTHNLHHLTLIRDADLVLDVAPVLEGPCWVDDGDVVYREAGDPRWYWDYSFVDQTALAVPIWGTDQWDGVTPITTVLTITPKATGTVTVLRFWMALARPYNSGYDAEVTIEARVSAGSYTEVWSGIIGPKAYSTRTVWVGREFLSITLDTPYAITSGTKIDLRFTTANAGNGVATIFALPTQDDVAFRAVTTCQGLLPEGSQPYPNRTWQYIDYPANTRYPVKPAIILSFGTGADATVPQFQAYVDADLQEFEDAVATWLPAQWSTVQVWEAPLIYFYLTIGDERDETNGVPYQTGTPIGWANPNRVDAVLQLISPSSSIIVDALRITIGQSENFEGGEGSPWNETEGTWADIENIRDARLRSYTAVFNLHIGDSAGGPWTLLGSFQIYRLSEGAAVDVDSFALTASVARYLKIEAVNGGPTAGGDQVCRWPVMKVDALYVSGEQSEAVAVNQMVYPFGSYYESGVGDLQQRPGFSDIDDDLRSVFQARGYSHGYTIQGIRNTVQSEFREPALRQTEWALGRWIIYGDQAPPVSSNNLAAISGFLFRDVPHRGVTWQVSLEADPLGNATLRQRAQTLDYVAFDAYSFNGAGAIAKGILNDGHTYIDISDVTGTFTPGQTVTEAGSGATATVVWYSEVEVLRVTNVSAGWLGGYRVVTGPSGSSTGSEFGPQTYADDKGWLQARGVHCLLIINNNLGTGDPDADIGSHVVNNPSPYVPLIVALAVDDGWEGVVCNLEAVPAADRAAASAFYATLARALHGAGKVLHATAPAATGTVYDADWWTGWCDHLALIKVCDAVKIMTYTESGPGTDPGPSAPQWFWDMVYGRLRLIIPEPYWPRILCGCRAFGHLWDLGTSPVEVEYMSYHDAISNALNYAKRIDAQDSEAGWGTDSIKCWFGTPDTVDRAQKEAAQWFGGLGLWKLDDGDLEEFFPDIRQIGRTLGMDFMDVRFPIDVSFGSSGGPRFSTSVVETQSGADVRNARWTLPLHEYDASFNVRTEDQLEAVRNLFMVARGKWRSFRFKDWSDYQLDHEILATADGVATNFQLNKTYAVGGYSLLRTITKPRTGTLVMYRNGVVIGGWTANYATGLVSFSAPPAAGTMSASCEFDVQVRFDVDGLPVELLTKKGNTSAILFSPGTIRLVEVRP